MKNIKDIKISPSIIATDLTLIGESVKNYNEDLIDLFHIDVMDGNFVPNITFGPGYIKDFKGKTSIPLDVHLMIEKPEASIDQYIDLKPWCITIHYESTRFPIRLLNFIRDKDIFAGIAINPATPVESIFDLIPYVDMILVMSVDPGFYGQSFLEISLERIKKISTYINNSSFKNVQVQVDGGINNSNISKVVDAGASIIVAGGSAFKGGKVDENVADLKSNAIHGK